MAIVIPAFTDNRGGAGSFDPLTLSNVSVVNGYCKDLSGCNPPVNDYRYATQTISINSRANCAPPKLIGTMTISGYYHAVSGNPAITAAEITGIAVTFADLFVADTTTVSPAPTVPSGYTQRGNEYVRLVNNRVESTISVPVTQLKSLNPYCDATKKYRKTSFAFAENSFDSATCLQRLAKQYSVKALLLVDGADAERTVLGDVGSLAGVLATDLAIEFGLACP
jgi:hypothetical protein